MIFKKDDKVKKSLIVDDGYLLEDDSDFAIKEAYKMIRTNLIFSLTQKEKCKKILITSSQQGEAKSTLAVNLAIAFAQIDENVLLIDCDLRLPTCASKLAKYGANRHAETGITNVLTGQCDIDDAILHLKNGLDFLPSGINSPNPLELLGSNAFKELMKILGEKYSYIVIDSPPVGTISDAVMIAPETSGVVLVARQGVSTHDKMEAAIERLKITKCKILGFVMTDVKNTSGKSDYYNSYGYGYENANRKK